MMTDPRKFIEQQKAYLLKSSSGLDFDVIKYQKVDAALNQMMDEYGADMEDFMKKKSVAAANEVSWVQQVHINQSIAIEKKL